jgi:hypothetical protein
MSKEMIQSGPQRDAHKRPRPTRGLLSVPWRAEPGKGRLRNHSPAGGGVLLVLLSLGLLLAGVTAPAPGLAAPVATLHPARVAPAPIGAATTTASTAFLPLVTRNDSKPHVWQGEYYDNPNLLGDPVFTTEETGIDHDWGDDGPDGLGVDNFFSIRWTGEWGFEAEEYTFFLYADDGVRLWLDDNLLIDAWTAGWGWHDITVPVDTAGLHRLKVEYFEQVGDAAIRLQWRRADLYPEWFGKYYDNAWVEDKPVDNQTDRVIQFDWGEGCPDFLPPGSCNRFSIAWEATPLFESGTQRIHLYADEGYRIYVDDVLLGDDGWYSGQSGEDDYYDFGGTGLETHKITYHFHDQGGPAEARLWIENLAHPLWTVEYFDNPNLSGPPDATDTDTAVFHDWGLGRPHRGLPTDQFSVRWTGQRYFHAGCYRFGLFADDGVRLRVDGELLVNEWHLGRAEHHSLVTYVGTGYHDVVIEYFDSTGEAEIRFWWE